MATKFCQNLEERGDKLFCGKAKSNILIHVSMKRQTVTYLSSSFYCNSKTSKFKNKCKVRERENAHATSLRGQLWSLTCSVFLKRWETPEAIKQKTRCVTIYYLEENKYIQNLYEIKILSIKSLSSSSCIFPYFIPNHYILLLFTPITKLFLPAHQS